MQIFSFLAQRMKSTNEIGFSGHMTYSKRAGKIHNGTILRKVNTVKKIEKMHCILIGTEVSKLDVIF